MRGDLGEAVPNGVLKGCAIRIVLRVEPFLFDKLSQSPGGLLTLNTRKGKPFGQCPDMVCQACGHGGCTLLPRSIGDSHTQCPYRPAEVITVQGEIGHRLMHVPVLREAVTLTHLTGVAVAVGAVLPFDKRGIDGLTHPRLCQGGQHCDRRAEDHPEVNLHDSALLPSLVHGGVLQLRGGYLVRGLGTPGLARAGRHDLGAIGVEDGGFIGGIFVTGEEIQRPASRALLEGLHPLLDVLCRPLTRHHADHPAVLGLQGHVRPMLPLLGIGGVLRIAGLFFLAHAGPFFVELHLACLGGKTRPTLHAGLGHGGQLKSSTALRSRGSLPRAGRSCAPRSPPQYGPARLPPLPRGGEPERGGSPCAQKSARGTCGSIAAAGACPCRSAYTTSDRLRSVYRRRRRLHSDSKSGRDRPWLTLYLLRFFGGHLFASGSVMADIVFGFNHNRPPGDCGSLSKRNGSTRSTILIAQPFSTPLGTASPRSPRI